MDGGILVISSPDGPMAQTREHILLSKQARAAECDALQIQNNKRCSLEQYLAAAQTATSQGGCAKARLLHEQGERRVCVIPKVVQNLVVCSLPDHVWIEAPS